jgi:protein gp37
MSDKTPIQWTDSSSNPIMGCGGCELFPESPRKVIEAVDLAVMTVDESWKEGQSQKLLTKLIHEQIEKIKDDPGYNPKHHTERVTNTNIWHMREIFENTIKQQNGPKAATAARKAIEKEITCYAAKLHLNKGYAITNPGKEVKKGYAPTFTTLTPFEGRMVAMAKKKDLLGTKDLYSPWKDGLPRMVFVSDMGDALTQHSPAHLAWLETEVLDPIRSENGQRHIWQWLTKRPQNMAKLSKRVGGLPENVCAMTTLTGADEKSLGRLEKLKEVEAGSRGLSLEPMWERIPPKVLDLDGIDWVIVGGESGSPNARPFDLAWARELRDHCQKQGVACFIKQLGRNPVENGQPLKLKNSHGGDWDKWPEDLRIREFPNAFYNYRSIPKRLTPTRPSTMKDKAKKTEIGKPLTEEQQARFKLLNATVKKAANSVIDASLALEEIRKDKLYRESYKTFAEYVENVHNLSRQYAYNLLKSGQASLELSAIADKYGLSEDQIPTTESQLRELSRVKDAEKRCEILAEIIEEKGPEYTAADLAEKVKVTLVNTEETGEPRPPTPGKRLEAARETLADLEGALNEYEGMSEVRKLLKSLRENLG